MFDQKLVIYLHDFAKKSHVLKFLIGLAFIIAQYHYKERFPNTRLNKELRLGPHSTSQCNLQNCINLIVKNIP